MNYSQNIVNWTMVQYSHFQLEKEMATHSKCSCLENPRDRGAWWAAVYGVAKSQTRLKRLSSSIVIVILAGGSSKSMEKLYYTGHALNREPFCYRNLTTQRDGIGREEGGGFRMGNTCIPVADSF